MVRNLAIIPARSGSKRVKDKNIRTLCGHPLLHWIVKSALESELFEYVYVSTDSEKYAEIARSSGASVPFLRDEFSDDKSGIANVVQRELFRIENFTGVKYDNVAVLQPTCPLLSPADIKAVYEKFLMSELPFAMTCFPFCHCNPWWAFKKGNDGKAKYLFSSPRTSRSQDFEQLYCPTGAFAIVNAAEFKSDPTAVADNCMYVPVSWESGFDIDCEADFNLAETLLKARSTRCSR